MSVNAVIRTKVGKMRGREEIVSIICWYFCLVRMGGLVWGVGIDFVESEGGVGRELN